MTGVVISGDVSGRKKWAPNSLFIEKARTQSLDRLIESMTWFALRVPAQKEFTAQEILKRRGVPTFCALDKRWRRTNCYAKEKRLIAYPMMARYIFAGFPDVNVPWLHIFNLRVVSGVVAIQGNPIVIPGDDMVRLTRRYRSGIERPAAEKKMKTNAEFKVGDMVQLAEGDAFNRWTLPIHELNKDDAIVMQSMFGQLRPIKVAVELLEPA